ncbi:GNAT family N-acetyltransferase [Aquimarina aggregata]|uniref:GNAT family N-acetyltransferase n=1 Tax=Aquimarina aggregata TaxID=1642818 RepID=UPI0024937C72|nr:GNAT family N-acetyltransferase [Aquimarina aggregata]
MHIISTKRLILRELSNNDIMPLFEILSDKETMQYYPATYTVEMTQSWINRNINSYRENGFGLWAVVLKKSEKMIGQCGISLQNIDRDIVPEIGYHIHKQHWNQGYATEAAKTAMDYGFKNLNMNNIYIHTYVKNVPSKHIAEKLGMSKVKEYDKQMKAHGVTWKHAVYMKIKPEK